MSISGLGQFLVGHPTSIQLSLFGTILLTVWLSELYAREETAGSKLRHTWTNALFLPGVVPAQILMMIPCIAAANWIAIHHVGLIYLLPNPENPWIKYGLMFLALDLLDYSYHYMAHHTPFIWRLHLVHHSDRTVDVSTTFREHPGETVIRIFVLTIGVIVLGASLNVLLLRQTFQSMSNILQHTSFRLPPLVSRVLGWVLVTPALHHTHHHSQRPGTDCNYGDVFSIWDRITGTFVHLPSDEVTYGLDTHATEASVTVSNLLGINALLALRSRKSV
jgi:sterol desaturase/sphingolipid hydroxylase (fatty acid hydroxylase superfamily)